MLKCHTSVLYLWGLSKYAKISVSVEMMASKNLNLKTTIFHIYTLKMSWGGCKGKFKISADCCK